jgi:uncharacterized protein
LAEKRRFSVDWQVAIQGILLHDIGVFECEKSYQPRVVKPYIQHALLGSLIVRAEGFSETVVKMVERHMGVGISREEIEEHNYALPRFDFIPETVEEKLLCYSDKFHSKEKGFVDIEYRQQQYRSFGKGPSTRLTAFVEMFGLPDLQIVDSK